MIGPAVAILTVRLAIGILSVLAISAVLGQPRDLSGRWWLNGVRLSCGIGFLILLLSWAIPHVVIFASSFRPAPTPVHEVWFEGVTYDRDVRRTPRPMVIHVVTIDLDAPGIAFLVTPPNPKDGMNLQGMTTGQFLDKYDLQVAINGDFFLPWSDNTLLEYYPHVGDPVDVLGYAASDGQIYSHGMVNHPTLYVSADNRVSFDKPIGAVYDAISGSGLIVKNGQPFQPGSSDSYLLELHPRTVAALDQTGLKLILILIDGRQTGYSEGASIAELAQIAIEHGAFEALNLDGGGSTTLVRAGLDGEPILINSPIHNHIPYFERPVANHLGVFATAK